jgi:hypothetical protein
VGGGCEEIQDKQLTLLYILDGREEARHARRAARRRVGSLVFSTATLEVLACIAFKATPNLFRVRPLFAGR